MLASWGTRAAFLKKLAVGSMLSLLLATCSTPYLQNPVPSEGFTNFETEPVRPLALSGDGRYLYALNTPDDRLEVFEATDAGLRSVGETVVGLRPVALALRKPGEVWVVNHLSDTVNIVDVRVPARPVVTHTLPVGDEPRGIVAAGPGGRWMFVAAAQRGDVLTPGIGRAQIRVFDAENPAKAPQILTLFGMKPRSLAVSPDGTRVYAAIFHSGNGTASVSGFDVNRFTNGPVYDLSSPPPRDAEPRTGRIVRKADGRWRDFAGQDWSSAVPFDLPDYDVFVIDASTDEPAVIDRVGGVGTVLFDLAVRPDNGEVWVSNTEAANFVPHEPQLRSRFAENRVTRLVPAAKGWKVLPVGLNPHVDLGRTPGPPAERARSLAQPLELVFDPGGEAAYLAAFGSARVAVLSRDAKVTATVDVGFGPAGLALDPVRHRLYVANRLDATISVIDTRALRVASTVSLRHDPTPAPVRKGRRLLYDARASSGHGTLSCATCHVFADVDGLAWDLGNPKGAVEPIPESLHHDLFSPFQAFHPLKGPMTTQSLRGLRATAPFHWRGDRFGHRSNTPGDDVASFRDFDVAFVDLMGMSSAPSGEDMAALAEFVLSIRYPPNPYEPFDRVRTAPQQRGFDFFDGEFHSDRALRNCADCHAAPLGTNRLINSEGFDVSRDMKTAHLRNVYQKVGRFNLPGPQVSGFGLMHDGSSDTIVNFLKADAFVFPGKTEAEKDAVRRDLSAFIMGFHTGMAPAVGRQLTVRGNADRREKAELSLLMQRAGLGECDLVAHAWEGGRERGWLLRGDKFAADSAAAAPADAADLVKRAHEVPVNFLCVPPGDGVRSALDRTLDGVLDGDAPQPRRVATDGIRP